MEADRVTALDGNNARDRLRFGSALTLVTLGLMSSPQITSVRLLLSLLIGSAILAALWEFYALCRLEGESAEEGVGMGIGGLYLLSAFTTGASALSLTLLSLGIAVTGLVSMKRDKPSIRSSAYTTMGWTYVLLPLSCLIFIHQLPASLLEVEGSWWLLFLYCTTKSADVGAYYCGRLWGRNRLAPKISPRKTVEGAIGGVVASLAVGSAIWSLWCSMGITQCLWSSLLGVALLACSIGILGQLSDLVESIVKRSVGAKDSGNVPAFGGVLDMVDSLIFTAPALYGILYWFGSGI